MVKLSGESPMLIIFCPNLTIAASMRLERIVRLLDEYPMSIKVRIKSTVAFLPINKAPLEATMTKRYKILERLRMKWS